MRNILKISGFFAAVILLAAVAGAQSKPGPKIEKNKYTRIVIAKFEIGPDADDMDGEMLDALMEEIADEIEETDTFGIVITESAPLPKDRQVPASVAKTTLRMEGRVTEFDRGDRALRLLLPTGAGGASIKAHVRFIDPEGNVLLEKKLGSNVLGGFVSLSRTEAFDQLGHKIARLAAKTFFDE